MISWIWAVMRAGFRQQMTYKGAMALGVTATFAYSLIRLVLLEALYEGRATVGGLTIEQATTWAILAGLLLIIIWVPWAHDLPEAIRAGTIVGDLLKPVHPFTFQLARQIGRMGALVLIRMVPIVLFGFVFLPLSRPDGALGWAYLAISVLLMMVSSIAFMYMLGTSAFFTADYHVWMALAFYTFQLIGGMFVPIEFMPGVIGTIMEWGPGMAFIASPTRIINGIHPLATLGVQAMWTVIFCLAAYAGLHLGRRRLVIYGG